MSDPLAEMQQSKSKNIRDVGDKMTIFLADLREKLNENPESRRFPSREKKGGGVFSELKKRLSHKKEEPSWREKAHRRKKLFGL